MKVRNVLVSLGAVSAAVALAACGSSSDTSTPSTDTGAAAPAGKLKVVLITKNNTNPFFVKMAEGAKAEADKVGVDFQHLAGASDGDNATQVAAIETSIAGGVKTILITPSDPKGIAPEIAKARAAGILVIALDTPTDPASAVDAIFATDNFQAGLLIGQWAKAKLGADAANAKIAMLDLNPDQVTVDVLRDQGFLQGFGIDIADKTKIGDESDARIVGHDVTNGAEDGGRTAMEHLLAKSPDINLVYTINEPAAAGAYAALKAAGKEKSVTIVSVDGGCAGVKNVAAGVIGATSQQYPLLMAQKGIDAAVAFAKDGTKPAPSTGLDFFNTGVNLITDAPQSGVPSKTTAEGLTICWG
jgi:fructose transport system substrate-binding protein